SRWQLHKFVTNSLRFARAVVVIIVTRSFGACRGLSIIEVNNETLLNTIAHRWFGDALRRSSDSLRPECAAAAASPKRETSAKRTAGSTRTSGAEYSERSATRRAGRRRRPPAVQGRQDQGLEDHDSRQSPARHTGGPRRQGLYRRRFR